MGAGKKDWWRTENPEVSFSEEEKTGRRRATYKHSACFCCWKTQRLMNVKRQKNKNDNTALEKGEKN